MLNLRYYNAQFSHSSFVPSRQMLFLYNRNVIKEHAYPLTTTKKYNIMSKMNYPKQYEVIFFWQR